MKKKTTGQATIPISGQMEVTPVTGNAAPISGGGLLPTDFINPAISPSEKQTLSTFSTIRQGTATNALTKTRTGKGSTHIDPITGTATITQGGLVVTLPNFEKLTGGLKTSTAQLLDALTVVLTESGAKNPSVTLSLDEYMSKRGLSDRKEARKQVTEDLDTLYNASISFKEKRRKQEQDFLDVRICDAKGIKNGIITFSFGSTFYNILLGYPVMPYPPQLLRLSGKRNPNSYYLLRKISEHKNMNIGKKNEDTIAVKTLLACSPYFLTYEEVMSGDRALNRRIIEPFERDMNALSDSLTWQYCHSNNEPLTDEELNSFPYAFFIKLLVKVFWITYPDQTARLEAKAQRETEEKRRTPSNKKPAEKTESGAEK